MRKVALTIAAAAAAAVPAAQAKPKVRTHVPGCKSGSCDDRIGAEWARKHRPRARLSSSPVTASWYGPGLYGNTTACGQVLQPGTAGVAHKGMACGKRVRICLAAARGCAGPLVTTRVIDRGPYVGGRTFDLTAPVRDAIGMGGGTAAVRYAAG